MIKPRPMAASAAATVITKIARIWPARSPSRKEKAMRLILTALNISSTDIKTVMKLRRTMSPMRPRQNRISESAT